MAEPVKMSSEEGSRLLSEVRAGGGLFQPIVWTIFAKQIGNKNCGIQSAALLLGAQDLGSNLASLNAADEVDLSRVSTRFNEKDIFDMPETNPVITQAQVQAEDGMTLEKVRQLLEAHRPGKVQLFRASDVTEDEFRKQTKEVLACTNSGSGVIVNYHMGVLGQGVPVGHHSPLAAYHERSDRFLIMDTWMATEPCWAKTADLHNAMDTLDDASGKTRGYCILKSA